MHALRRFDRNAMNNGLQTFRLVTFGCKVNQYETDALRRQCVAAGMEETGGSAADLVIVNTCGVTARAAGKSRRAARAALRGNPRAVVAAGCAVDLNRSDFEAIPGLRIVPQAQKARFLESLLPSRPSDARPECRRTRALLKIQDGCNQFCSYCVVPHVRSTQWSKPFDEALEEARRLAAAGHREIVLTGVRLGLYDGGDSLARLLAALEEIDGLERVRFSSIEINEIGDPLLAAMARSTKFCPHLHLPLQSGDDAVLARMNRPYASGEYLRRLGDIRAALGRTAVTTDVIVGFPGETAEQFENTLRACREAAFGKIHIFPFSPRRPAPAAEMPGRIPPGEIRRRAALLAALERELAAEYRRPMLGGVADVLVEGRVDGLLEGKTGDYVTVAFDGDDSSIGEIVHVCITDVGGRRLRGEKASEREASECKSKKRYSSSSGNPRTYC